MKKIITAVAAAATLALVVGGAPNQAHAQRGAVAAGVLGGLAAGAIIGSAAAGPRYYEPAPVYGPAPVYAAPPGCVSQQWVWSPRRGEYVLRNVAVPC